MAAPPLKECAMQKDYFHDSDVHVPKRRRFSFRIAPLPADKPWINIVLFLATLWATWLTWGVWYSLSVIAILLAHEMGHYLMCRRYRIPATLPFFIPFPLLNPFGTLGAMIQIRGLMPNRRALFDVGAAGPIAGLLVTLPVIFLGVRLSQIVPVQQINENAITLGESLAFKFISRLAIGSLPEDYEVMLHPLAYAGWVGLFVTSLNLLPIGQLDGGHIFYSLFGRRGFRLMPLFLVAFGILTIIYYGWGLLFILLLLLGRRHPPPIDDFTPLDLKRKILAYIIFFIFVTSFTPMPFIF